MERFLDYFVPEKYILDLTIDKDEKRIGGVVTVSGEVLTDTVKFHAVGLDVDAVKVDESDVKYSVADGVLTIEELTAGDRTIEIRYHGKLNENMEGAYLSTYEHDGGTEVIVATQFESHYAREAFPCIDEPAAKAVFELSLTVPENGDMVMVNTAVKNVDKNVKLKDTDFEKSAKSAVKKFDKYTFEPTPKMSTYLLAWVIGKFHGKTIKNAHGVEITTYAALNQDVNSVDFANEVAARSLEFYDDNFGVPYPLAKLTQVALPDFEAGAMENWGLVTYRETMLLAGDNATLGTKKSVALTVAHELSHQWFGDLVTMKWWDDLWLNESFASVMEYYATDYIYPEFKIFEGFFTGDCLAALKRDAYKGVQSVHQDVHDPAEIATLFDSAIVYSKGARLMLMVIRAMGWENFCASIREYFEKYQYGNTVGDDLWCELNKHAGFDVGGMMHAFIDRPGYPVLSYEKDGFSQKRFLMDGEMEKSDWPIPEVKEDMSGHYIINLTDAEFDERLARFDELTLEEKLRLLIDRDLVTKTDLAASASLIPLVQKFKTEKSAAVWNIIVTIISGLKIFFEYDSPEEKQFKNFVKELVRPNLDEIGLVTRKGDDENILRLRANLSALDFYAEDVENLRKLADIYNDDFAKIDNEIRNDVLDVKVYLEPEMVDKYIAAFRNMADPEIKFDLLFAMTLVKDEKELEKLVGLLSRPEVVKPQDQFYLYIWLYRNPKAKKMAWEWLKNNWEYVKKISGDKSLDNYPRYIANSVRTESEFEEYKEFFDAEKDDPALKRAIEVGKNEINARIKLIESDKDAILKVWNTTRA